MMPGKKSYIIAYFCLIMLGFLGAHHFYLNNYILGIIYLLTGGFFGIGIIVDLFILPIYVWHYNKYMDQEWRDIFDRAAECIQNRCDG